MARIRSLESRLEQSLHSHRLDVALLVRQRDFMLHTFSAVVSRLLVTLARAIFPELFNYVVSEMTVNQPDLQDRITRTWNAVDSEELYSRLFESLYAEMFNTVSVCNVRIHALLDTPLMKQRLAGLANQESVLHTQAMDGLSPRQGIASHCRCSVAAIPLLEAGIFFLDLVCSMAVPRYVLG